MIRSTDIIAPVGGQGVVHDVQLVSELQQFPCEKVPTIGGARSVERNTIESIQNRLPAVQTGESIDLANVFKPHALHHGLCANLINAKNLLANHQDDGDGLIHNILTNFGKGSRKGATEGLREFLKIDKE